ncbi:V-type proton ATPase subunit C [Glycine soja]|uniref:V-type proton ATPase subunit C n=1 Tax=Glycine soja TaxID=3848 RepID=A0A0B2QSD0_GLYSO|nr:V-type proton ATPase subunit C [Glycine soja]
MDFIGGLPKVQGTDTIMVVVDRLTKYAHFLPVSHPYTAKDIASLFIKEIVRLHGFPTSIVSDRDKVFLSNFWYPTMLPLKEIIDGIHGQVAKNEDDLKVHVSEYNNICSQLNAINRKQIGSLAVCDLSNLVKPEDIITLENLTTLLAIDPKYSQKDWLFGYETLTNYVVRVTFFNL